MKYVHTNLISKDWKALAAFYIQVFECKMILPQRNMSGKWLSNGTGVNNAKIKGAHLRLPGYDKSGPTLEIFEYSETKEQPNQVANRKGFGHLAFEVDNVQEVVFKAMNFGAKTYGQIAKKNIDGLGLLTFVYIKDPEGNIIEIQNWSKEGASSEEKKSLKTVKKEGKSSKDSSKKTKSKNNIKNPVKVFSKKGQKTKRELLDELQKDLDQSKKVIRASKEEIRSSKADVKSNKNKGIDLEITEEESAMLDDFEIKKTKAELLAELKKEMEVSEEKDNSNSTKKTKTKQLRKDTPKASEYNTIQKLHKKEARLKVEIKTAKGISVLDLTKVKLSKPISVVAQNLRSFITLLRPDDYEFLFIEWVGKLYKADIVPLQKQFKSSNTTDQNEKAWIITPRLRDSLYHLLGKCKSDPEILLELKLDSIGLTPKEFRITYENLLSITLTAEKHKASYMRLDFSDI
ncbi:MAG: VOC family protein [Saprospiraceae bacterium]|nr:VOC family protein [Saprospiraceae bacterium]